MRKIFLSLQKTVLDKLHLSPYGLRPSVNILFNGFFHSIIILILRRGEDNKSFENNSPIFLPH